MQDAPKIVRERLRAAMPVVNHPDPDVLTAFSERSLPQLERDIVLEHLARCGDCRDVVALALPATEPLQIPAKAPSGGWLAWPTLRWGFVAAGILAIGSLGIVQFQRHTESQKQFHSSLHQAADTEAAGTEAKNEAPAVSSAAPPARERDSASALPAANPSAGEKKFSANIHQPQAPPPPAESSAYMAK